MGFDGGSAGGAKLQHAPAPSSPHRQERLSFPAWEKCGPGLWNLQEPPPNAFPPPPPVTQTRPAPLKQQTGVDVPVRCSAGGWRLI